MRNTAVSDHPNPRLPGVRVLRDVPDGTTLTAEAIVIGSGAGGAAVAGELRRGGMSVLLLEAGDLPHEHALGSHIHSAFPRESQLETEYGPAVWQRLAPYQRDRPLPALTGASTVHAVGGLLSFWSHMCARPDAATEGEPTIPVDELERLWDDAATRLWASVDVERGGVRQGRIERAVAARYPDLPPTRSVQQLPIAARRRPDGSVEFAGIDALLETDPDTDAGPLTIVAGYPARRIETTGGVAIGVTAADWSGRRTIALRGAVVVVAGGALAAPQLLHVSGIRPAALGHYLTDHTMAASRIGLAREFLADVPDDDPTFSVWIPASTDRPVHAQVARGWVSAAPFVGDLDHRSTADISQFTGVDPHPDNRLRFDDADLDAWGLPRVSAEFRLGPDDRARLDLMIADHARLADTLRDPGLGFAISIAPPGGSLHLMGTTRLGADETDSVADSRGRVWGTSNVYVAGNNVISTRNAGNPTLNTVALGLRTARSILGRSDR